MSEESKKDDGRPAFPLPCEADVDCAGRAKSGYGGMTLRQYYAGQALSAFTTVKNPEGYAVCYSWTPERIASKCCEIADALVAELKK
jgi:hypothetical protein